MVPSSQFVEYDESTDPYYATRQFLIPQYRHLPTEDIESLLVETFPEMSPEDAESFFRDIGRSLGNFGREVGRRAPGIVSGAVTGATTGAALGPFGALGGALAGGALGGATYQPQSRGPSAAGIAQQMGGQALGALSRSGGTAGLIGSLGQTAMGALASGQRGAGGQLAAMLSQPQTLQAVLNAMTGSAGSGRISAGGRSLPVQSILGALGTLATRAAEEYEMAGEIALGEGLGESAFDRANPDEQATYILETLYSANESLFAEYDEYNDESFDEYDESDDEYDENDFESDFENIEFDELRRRFRDGRVVTRRRFRDGRVVTRVRYPSGRVMTRVSRRRGRGQNWSNPRRVVAPLNREEDLNESFDEYDESYDEVAEFDESFYEMLEDFEYDEDED